MRFSELDSIQTTSYIPITAVGTARIPIVLDLSEVHVQLKLADKQNVLNHAIYNILLFSLTFAAHLDLSFHLKTPLPQRKTAWR